MRGIATSLPAPRAQAMLVAATLLLPGHALAHALTLARQGAPATEKASQDAKPTPPATPPTASTSEAASERRERARTSAEESLRKSVLPKPIERARFVAFLSAIDPALAGNTALLEAHSAQADALEKQNETAARQILRLLPAAYSYDAAREAFEPRATPELVALLALRDKCARALTASERKLLDAVEAAMPREAKARYASALLALRSEQLPRAALLPSTHVTLLELLPQLRLGTEGRARIDEPLAIYAAALAKALSERAQLLQQADGARAIIETTAGTLWRYAPAEIADAVEHQLGELDDRDFASEIAIRAQQFDALARIRARLEPKDGRRLVELWQRTLHPELFDDERLLARIVEDTLAHPAFDADHDTALLDALETAYQRLEPLSRAACEAADLVLPRLASRTQESMSAEIDARIAVIKAQHRRRDIIKDTMQRVRGMLGDADPAMTARIEDAIASLDSLERADTFEEKALAARRDALADAPATANGARAADAQPAATPGAGGTSAGDASTKPDGTATKSADSPSGSTTDAPARNGRGSRGNRRSGGN